MKSFIIPIFIPHWGCRHQCVFCSQNTITGHHTPMQADTVYREIQAGLARLTAPRRVEVAYYGGSFTALPLSVQAELLTPAYQALNQGLVHGIRLSTRPDCITSKIIEHLKAFAVGTVELGIQSFDDRVLLQSERGHTAADSMLALHKLKAAGFRTVAQLMVGLPGESWDSLIKSSRMITQARPHSIRIYPTVVLEGTPLATLYRQGRYCPLSLTEAISKAAYLKCQAEYQGISVIRVGLQATEDLHADGAILAGPYHPSFGEMVASRLFYLMVASAFETACVAELSVTLYHHPKDHSKARGIANQNLHRWQEVYRVTVVCRPDDTLQLGELRLHYADASMLINSSILSFL